MNIQKVYDIVVKLPRAIGKLPKSIIGEMKKEAGSIIEIVEPLKKTIPVLKQPIEASADLIHYMGEQGSIMHGECERFRKQLLTFSNGIENCIIQVNSLISEVDKNLPEIIAVSAFVNELQEKVINAIPDIVLFPIAKALLDQAGWSNKPDEIKKLIESMGKKLKSTSIEHQKEIDLSFILIQLHLNLANSYIKLIQNLLPTDLEVSLELVGEGAGVTISSHPYTWKFTVFSYVIEQIITMLSATKDIIDLSREIPFCTYNSLRE